MNNRRFRWVLAGCALILLKATAACMYSPTNGQTYGSNGAQPFIITAFNEPNALVTVQALRDPGGAAAWSNNNLPDDPADPLWGTLISGTTGSQPYYWNDSDPLYLFSGYIDPTLFPSDWKPGGVLRVRAFGHSNSYGSDRILQVYDEDQQSCFNAFPNDSWKSLGGDCGSPYSSFNFNSNFIANFVATAPLPSVNHDGQLQFLYIKGTNLATDTESYYTNIGLALNFTAFQQAYGFAQIQPGNNAPGVSAAGEITTAYFNAYDLEVGREMHCIKSTQPATLNQIACYVSNFGSFGGSQSQALAGWQSQTIIATVAMVYNPSLGSDDDDVVKFKVFDALGNAANRARLDTSANVNDSVPNNCMVCHGASTSYVNNHVSGGARFLPFDLHTIGFYSADPANALSRARQEDFFRQQNVLVSQVAATQTTQNLLSAWYGGNLNVQGTPQSDTAVPAAWAGSKSTNKLYLEVVANYCRTCHQTDHGPNNAVTSLDWHQSSDFLNSASSILQAVCNGRQGGFPPQLMMPQAKVTQDLLWSQQGRAHLIAGLTQPTGSQPGFFGNTASCNVDLQ